MLRHVLPWLIACLCLLAGCGSQTPDDPFARDVPPAALYDPGAYTVQDLWVDPTNGQDTRTGATRALALRTVNEAWGRIPVSATLATGYRLRLCAGTYPRDALPYYWENRRGTQQHPIILEAADAPGSALFQGDLNVFACSYLYLRNFALVPNPPGDVLHLERCHHVWVTGMRLNGGGAAQETIKANQSHHLYLDSSEISGACENCIDYVAVHHSSIVNNRLHDGGDWIMYVKGGSAYIRVEGNELYNGGTGGFSAGQGTGFEFMRAPWLHYEAYDVKFINNVVHDTEGAGMGVNGGYNVLLAYNTLYRVGSRSHAIEVVHGLRSCDGNVPRARQLLALGGWGTTSRTGQRIPCRNVFIYNNVLYNPPGFRSQWGHFSVHGPSRPGAGTNIPSPSRCDTNLRIRGNIIWNGPADLALGLGGDGEGGQAANPTCNPTLVRAQNAINTIRPQLIDPAGGNFRPKPGGNVAHYVAQSIPDYTWSDAPHPPTVPQGTLGNRVTTNREGAARPATGDHPGAY